MTSRASDLKPGIWSELHGPVGICLQGRQALLPRRQHECFQLQALEHKARLQKGTPGSVSSCTVASIRTYWCDGQVGALAWQAARHGKHTSLHAADDCVSPRIWSSCAAKACRYCCHNAANSPRGMAATWKLSHHIPHYVTGRLCSSTSFPRASLVTMRSAAVSPYSRRVS